MQSPEILLPSLNNALRRLRGACAVLENEEINEKLLEVMRRLILAELLGNTWIIAIGGSQGAGKTTLVSAMYDLQSDNNRWLQGNEGRGEKMPVLIYETDGVQVPQGYVRRLVLNKDNGCFELREEIVNDVAEFQKAVCDPRPEDLRPVLRVPRRYFKRDNQAWLLLPGYEKQERANRSWQELMRQAMVAAGGCVVVTDETRMANQQQLEIVQDMLGNELKNRIPYIVISKTEAHRENLERRKELIASAKTTFQVSDKFADKHIILTGTDDPEYIGEWMCLLRDAIDDLSLSGQASRTLQMTHLAEIIGKDLTRVLNSIRSKSRLYFASTSGGTEDSPSMVLEKVLEEFDIAAESLREKHNKEIEANADRAFTNAAKTMGDLLMADHEGFKNWLSNAMDSTSETSKKMRTLVHRSWQNAAPKFYSDYLNSLTEITSEKLGRIGDENPQVPNQERMLHNQSEKLIKLGYLHASGKPATYQKLKTDVIKDVRILLGNSSEEEEKSYENTSKKLGVSVALLPALTLEYSRIAYSMPESWGLKQDYTLTDTPSDTNMAKEGVENVKAGVELGRTAIKSFAALMAVDVVSDGDADILSVFTNNAPTDASTPLPVGTPLTLHPAAVAVTAVVAGAYVASVAVTRIRTFERQASAQAHSMLTNVRDQQVKHLRQHFDHAMDVARERIKEKLQIRYRLNETLMKKDRLAVAIADVSAIAHDLRYELESSAIGLQPLLATGA